jgi:hypothetical protein
MLRFNRAKVLISVFIINLFYFLQCVLHVTVSLCFISIVAQDPPVCLVLCIMCSTICH